MLKFIYSFYAPGYTQGYTLIREDQNMETLNHSCYDRRYELLHKVRPLYYILQPASRFVTMRPFVTSNIIGATSMEQLKPAIGSHEINLTPEIEKEIESIHLRQPNPCP